MTKCFVTAADYAQHWMRQPTSTVTATVTVSAPAPYLGIERRRGADRRAPDERRQPRTPGNDRRWRQRDRRGRGAA